MNYIEMGNLSSKYDIYQFFCPIFDTLAVN